jgi:cytochrome bd-type quinol oxidase subunit 2
MTCAAAVYPLLASVASLFLMALAAVLLSESADANRTRISDEAVFATIILAATTLSFIVCTIVTAHKYFEPQRMASDTEARPMVVATVRSLLFALAVVVVALASLVLSKVANAPSPSVNQKSSVVFAAIILAAACVVLVATGTLLGLQIRDACRRGSTVELPAQLRHQSSPARRVNQFATNQTSMEFEDL